MTQPIIAIDIDDTIADSTESVRLLTNQKTGSNLSPEIYRAVGEYWGYYDRIWREHQLDKRISFEDYSQEMVNDQSQVPLLPGALFAIKQLAKKHEIILITARDRSWEKATNDWIKQYLPDIPISLYFSNSHQETDGLSKGQICASLDVKILVDDNVEHCLSAVEAGVEAILFGEYGWQHPVREDITRCRDWQAVLEVIASGDN